MVWLGVYTIMYVHHKIRIKSLTQCLHVITKVFRFFQFVFPSYPSHFELYATSFWNLKEIFKSTKQLYTSTLPAKLNESNCLRRHVAWNLYTILFLYGLVTMRLSAFLVVWCVIIFIRLNSCVERRQKDVAFFGE